MKTIIGTLKENVARLHEGRGESYKPGDVAVWKCRSDCSVFVTIIERPASRERASRAFGAACFPTRGPLTDSSPGVFPGGGVRR